MTTQTKPTVITIPEAAKAYVAALRAELKAAKSAHEKAASALDTLRDSLKGHDAINAERWKKVYAKPFGEALAKVYENADSRKSALNRIKVAAVALTNGIVPEAGETLQGFAKRILPTVKSSGAYAPATGGGAKGKPKGKGKGKGKGDAKPKVTRAEAALILAKGDKADADMLVALCADMKVLRALYAKVDPAK
jgi:hypothetical protein